MILKTILIIFIISALWSFIAYVFYNIGLMLKIDKSYYWYLIPIYNVWILAKKVYFSAYLFSLFFIIPIVNLVILMVKVSNFESEQAVDQGINLIYAMIGISYLIMRGSYLSMIDLCSQRMAGNSNYPV